MTVVLYFRSSTTSRPEKLAGILEVAEKKKIHVQVVEEFPTAGRVRRLVDFWHPRGIIVECGNLEKAVRTASFGDTPTVFFNRSFDALPPTCFVVRHDSRGTGALAARELLQSGASDFAYVPMHANPFWCRKRQQGFLETLRESGRRCHVLAWPKSARTATDRIRHLRTFLRRLPKPCAVFAANDAVAAETLTACRLSGVAIPQDIAVLGVDNSADVCKHTTPSLSSIEPDFRRGGKLSMLMLLAILQNPSDFCGPRQRTYGDLRVVRRLSTKRLYRADPIVSAALDLIRQRACLGLTAAEVARTFPCGRRMADLRFTQAVGHSILEEIHAVRLERAQELLRNPNQELKTISDFCGFRNPNSLRKFFRKATGQTLSAWRAAQSKD